MLNVDITAEVINCELIRNLKNSYKMEKFLHFDVDKFALSIFAKIRISNSNLNIERGRYIKLPVEKRICPLCNIEPEDEIHFILKCPKLDECRKELFSNISSVIWMSSKNLNSY